MSFFVSLVETGGPPAEGIKDNDRTTIGNTNGTPGEVVLRAMGLVTLVLKVTK